jgi:glycosyltransferase involved in cell wall biosynthesis
VTLVTPLAAPYRLASFEALAARREIALTVVFLLRQDPRWPWGEPTEALKFAHEFLNPHKGSTISIIGALKRSRPDVVIVGGWDRIAYLTCFAMQPFSSFDVVLWSESTTIDSRRSSYLRTKVKRTVVARSAATMVPGTAAAEFAKALGAKKIAVARNAVGLPDSASLHHLVESTGNDPLFSNGRDCPTALYVGRLSNEKGVDVLLEAWSKVQHRIEAQLVIVGSGPEEPALRRMEASLGLQAVRWIPFLPPSQLDQWYRSADVLILPSRSEPWGFVINEAMGEGLPVIASEVCGAARDLIKDGVTGWTVPREDSDALADRMVEVLTDGSLRANVAMAATAVISEYTPDSWASSVSALVKSLVASRA